LVEAAENCGAIDPVLSADCEDADIAKDRAIELMMKNFLMNMDSAGRGWMRRLKTRLFKQNK